MLTYGLILGAVIALVWLEIVRAPMLEEDPLEGTIELSERTESGKLIDAAYRRAEETEL